MHIIIFGGSGGLGHTIIRHLRTCCNASITNFSKNKSIDLADNNITNCTSNYHAVRNAIHPKSVIIHLANQRPRQYLENPIQSYALDLIATQNICHAAIEKNAHQFIFASSGGAIYGPSNGEPIAEHALLKPTHPYGLSKLHQEREIHRILHKENTSLLLLRIANIYGFQNPEDQDDLISKLTCTAPYQRFPILGNGNAVRDFIHTSDVAMAFEKAIKIKGHYTVNIGTGIGTRCIDIAQMMGHIHHLNLQLEFTDSRPHDANHNVLYIEKAKKVLNWSPSIDIESGIANLKMSNAN